MLFQINKITLVPRIADTNTFFFGSCDNTITSLTSQLKNNKLLSLKSRQKYQKIIDNPYKLRVGLIDIPYFTITGYKNSNSIMWTTSFLPETVDALGIKGVLLLWSIYWYQPNNVIWNVNHPINKLWQAITL